MRLAVLITGKIELRQKSCYYRQRRALYNDKRFNI